MSAEASGKSAEVSVVKSAVKSVVVVVAVVLLLKLFQVNLEFWTIFGLFMIALGVVLTAIWANVRIAHWDRCTQRLQERLEGAVRWVEAASSDQERDKAETERKCVDQDLRNAQRKRAHLEKKHPIRSFMRTSFALSFFLIVMTIVGLAGGTLTAVDDALHGSPDAVELPSKGASSDDVQTVLKHRKKCKSHASQVKVNADGNGRHAVCKHKKK